MSRWHNYYCDNHARFCTATVADWAARLDRYAINVLWDEWEKARAALNVKILAYCVMPEHYHIVLWAEWGENVKKFLHRTLAQVSRRLHPGGGFWKERPRVFPTNKSAVLKAKVNYIHHNPVKRRLVENPEDWPYSSFRQLMLGICGSEFKCDEWTMISL